MFKVEEGNFSNKDLQLQSSHRLIETEDGETSEQIAEKFPCLIGKWVVIRYRFASIDMWSLFQMENK